MYIQKTITLAIEGGYVSLLYPQTHMQKCQWFLDPLFWQSLGKSLEWEEFAEGYDVEGDYGKMPTWRYNWHRFIDHLASGHDPENFFKEILSE